MRSPGEYRHKIRRLHSPQGAWFAAPLWIQGACSLVNHNWGVAKGLASFVLARSGTKETNCSSSVNDFRMTLECAVCS